MTHTAIENIKRYISDKIDVAMMIFEGSDAQGVIEIDEEVHGCRLIATIEYTMEREYYTEFSTDNLTPPEERLRDWSFSLDSQYWMWIDENGDEHDITNDVQLNESDLEKELDRILTYYYK